MDRRVYLDTTVISYLAARASRLAYARKIGAVCRDAGYEPPVICTPEELMGD
jgi:hypothetical protein